jgi:predicted small lipoprotein YifL
MSTSRSFGITALLIAAGLALAGCGTAEGADIPPAEVATVDTTQQGQPGVITLVDAAAQRLGMQTAPVAAGPTGLTVPYGALVYQADGSAWVFVQTAPLTYQRASVAVTGISGGQVTLSSGPAAGTAVVTVGAAELIGVENGIDGEE